MGLFDREDRGIVARLKAPIVVSMLIAALAVAPASAGPPRTAASSQLGATSAAPALLLAQLPATSSISGTVTNPAGAALAGVVAEAYSWGCVCIKSATTSADGSYQVTGLIRGLYNVRFTPATDSGYLVQYWDHVLTSSSSSDVRVDQGTDTPGIDAQLVVGGSISGSVTDSSGSPIANIPVTARTTSGAASTVSVDTAADGTYHLVGISPGTYKVRFEPRRGSAYQDEYWNNVRDFASATTLTSSLGVDTLGIDAQLVTLGSISGVVTDPNGTPVPGVNVYAQGIGIAGGGNATTAADGTYQVVGLNAGNYSVQFTPHDPFSGPSLTPEYWNNAADSWSAIPVPVVDEVNTPGISVQLAAGPLVCSGLIVTVDMSKGEVPTAGPDVILGTAGPDVIDALGGHDTVCAGAGDDIVIGGGGNDVIYGETGNDDLRGQTGGDIIVGGLGDDLIRGHAGDDTLYGGLGIDTIYGGSGADRILGGDGNDIVQGAAGDDTIFGEAGDDFLVGGNDNDVIDGGLGADVIYLTAGNDTGVGGDGIDEIRGGSGLDTINGGVGNDVLYGSTMADTINGGDGDDTIFGEAGNDVLNGDAGVDLIRGGDGADTINGGAGNDTLNGDNGNDTVSGGLGDDIVRGQNNNDSLFGGDGIDTLIGGNGLDSMSGGLGSPDTCNGGLLTDAADVTCEMLVNIP